MYRLLGAIVAIYLKIILNIYRQGSYKPIRWQKDQWQLFLPISLWHLYKNISTIIM